MKKNLSKTKSAVMLVTFYFLLSSAFAQNYFYAAFPGDSIKLSVDVPNNSNVKWQQSSDTADAGNWQDISGADTAVYTHCTQTSGNDFWFYRAEIQNDSVCANPWYSHIVKSRIISNTADIQIGDYYAGGLVFYKNNAEGYGLIAALSDQDTAQWGCYGTAIPGADGIAIGTGQQNTDSIIANCSDTDNAANLCNNYIYAGYNDWFLPSIDELDAIYTNLHQQGFGGFEEDGYYWSSSEYSNNNAWIQNFSNGIPDYNNKGIYDYYVRAARKFCLTPSIANAGIDSLNIAGNTVTLNANQPQVGTGNWSVFSGTDGSFGDDTNPTTTFTGTAGTTYQLVWTITNACSQSSSDTVTIGFANTGTFTCGDSVTFTYKGVEVTYGTVESAGQCWLDRNLGATQVATSSTDAAAYGDLFQWGRAADGHQIRTSGTTTTNATTAVPNNGNAWDGLFITEGSSPYDWLSPQNENLWQDVNGTNNPCPAGWRLPTAAELDAERQSWSSNNAAGAFASPLKLPVAGNRDGSNGSLRVVGSGGYYWSSTVGGTGSRYLGFGSGDAGMDSGSRALGLTVRCFKN